MDAATTVRKLNPLDGLADRMFEPIREQFFTGVQFSEPSGDPGWFGPGSAVWYVHEHLPVVQVALAAAAMMETLHPDMAWMAYEHTRAIERVDGVPTGRFDDDAMASRTGHTLSFFLGVAFGPSAVADRLTRVVRGIHEHVRGTRPDGRDYFANDPELLRWNYATQAWALGAAHERYHPRPLQGERLDDFFREYTRMGVALGASDLPTTKAGIDEYLAESVPLLGVTLPTVDLLNPLAPWRYPRHQRPLYHLMQWAVQDLHPDWAQRLMNVPQHSAVATRARRAATWSLLNSARSGGVIREVTQSHRRADGDALAVLDAR